MRKVMLILVAALVFGGVATAQETPAVEVFGGYTYIHAHVGNVTISPTVVGPLAASAASAVSAVPAASSTDPSVTSNIHGGSGSIAYNVNHWFGVVADLGGSKISSLDAGSLGSASVDGVLFTYLFGPRFSYRQHERFTPFVQVLAGGAHISDITAPGITLLSSSNAFAMSAGGGLDIKVHKNVAVRAFQFEYLMTRFPDISSVTGATGTQNNMRLSAGIVFRFGER